MWVPMNLPTHQVCVIGVVPLRRAPGELTNALLAALDKIVGMVGAALPVNALEPAPDSGPARLLGSRSPFDIVNQSGLAVPQVFSILPPTYHIGKAASDSGLPQVAFRAVTPLLPQDTVEDMIITTFKTDADLYRKDENRRQRNPFIYNFPPTTDHLELLFFETPYPVYIRNSLIIGVAVVAVTLA